MKKIIYIFFIFLQVNFSHAQIGPIYIELDNSDPLENFNRSIFDFNYVIDESVIKPAAVFYRDVSPKFVQDGVSNFFSNLSEVGTIANEVLQLKFDSAFTSLARFVINSTFGILGVIDVASDQGLMKTKEDLGQTLGYWGVPEGPYIVMPILGPTNLRDSLGMVVDSSSNTNLLNNLDTFGAATSYSLNAIDNRSRLIPVTDMIDRSFDPYTTMKNSYSQKRRYDVYDGNPPVLKNIDF